MEDIKFEKLEECTYCKSKNIVFVFFAPNRFSDSNDFFSLSKCIDCGIYFQNPRIKEKYINLYYTDDLGYYCPKTKKTSLLKEKIKLILDREILVNYFNYSNFKNKNLFLKLLLYPFKRKYKIKLIPDFIVNGNLLEIGCSHGANLKKMKEIGWNVIGLEMNKKSADYAKSLGLVVYTDKIENINFSDNNFDVISMSMVLEHLYNPFESLDNITKWLKPKGQLIFSIPYFNGFEFKLFKEYSYGLQLPHHINFFNKKILKEYLSKLGYTDIKFYFQYFDRDIVASASYKYDNTGKYIYKILSRNKFIRYTLIKPIVYIMSIFGKTSRVTVYAKKR